MTGTAHAERERVYMGNRAQSNDIEGNRWDSEMVRLTVYRDQTEGNSTKDPLSHAQSQRHANKMIQKLETRSIADDGAKRREKSPPSSFPFPVLRLYASTPGSPSASPHPEPRSQPSR